MGENFKTWLEKEIEQARKDSHDQDTWKRKLADDRRYSLEAALNMLKEFKALHKDHKQD
jgi:hypothetical protein